MKKLKVYIETSIISHLKAEDVPEKMQTTLKLWEEIKNGLYDILERLKYLKEKGEKAEALYESRKSVKV